jgi:hypothetical protein
VSYYSRLLVSTGAQFEETTIEETLGTLRIHRLWVLHYGCLIHFSRNAAQFPLKTCCLSSNLKLRSTFTFTLVFGHHLLFGRHIFTKLRAGKHSAQWFKDNWSQWGTDWEDLHVNWVLQCASGNWKLLFWNFFWLYLFIIYLFLTQLSQNCI